MVVLTLMLILMLMLLSILMLMLLSISMYEFMMPIHKMLIE